MTITVRLTTLMIAHSAVLGNSRRIELLLSVACLGFMAVFQMASDIQVEGSSVLLWFASRSLCLSEPRNQRVSIEHVSFIVQPLR